MIVNELFRLPIFQIEVNDWNSKRDAWEEMWDHGNYYYQENKIQSYHTDRQRTDGEYLDEFINIFSDELNEFGQEIDCSYFKIVDVWTVKYGKGDYQVPHNHTEGRWSALLPIVQTNDHPKTMFMQPFPNIFNGHTEHVPLMNSQEGLMTFFPSFLLHYAPRNSSEETRIVTAFDIMPNL